MSKTAKAIEARDPSWASAVTESSSIASDSPENIDCLTPRRADADDALPTSPESREWQKWGATLLVIIVLVCVKENWMVGANAPTTEPVVFDASHPPHFELDINTATEGQLKALPNIGPRLANGIVSHRDEHGPYETLDQLLEVRGLGPAKLNGIRSMLRLTENHPEENPTTHVSERTAPLDQSLTQTQTKSVSR